MTRKREAHKPASPQHDGQAPVRLVEQLADAHRLVDDYEEAPGEAVGACLGEWLTLSGRIATIKGRIALKHLMANGVRKQDAKPLIEEANRMETHEMGPMLDELETMTWRMVDLLITHEAIRQNTENWLRYPKKLRQMLKTGLYSRKVDVREIVERADLVEAEREKRQILSSA